MTILQRVQAGLPDRRAAALVTSLPNRQFLTGFRSSAGAVLVTPTDGFFLTDFRYIEAAENQITAMPSVRYTRMADTVNELLAARGIRQVLVEAEGMSVAEFSRLQREMPDVRLCGDGTLDRLLQELRLCKTPEALRQIRQAQQLTDDGFAHILEYIQLGRTEREIALELEFFMRRQGAQAVAFDFIVVSGVNASLPHGVPTDKAVEDGDFVTMDFGAVVDGWHSDMTRTVAVGHADEEQRRVYEVVLEAQLRALRTLRAGLPCVEGDAAARGVIAAAGYGECFGHSTGHGVGLEIHEQPRLSPSAGGQVLRAGQVVTVEPGIYLPGKWGVRIEDLVVVTQDGCENLTRSPKSLIVL